jgi:hypothetical protein
MRVRITVIPTDDRAEDLRTAANVRRDLFAHSPVEIDPDNPLHGTHRDDQGRAYFEFSTEFPDEVRRVIEQFGHQDRVEVTPVHEEIGDACQNCGNIAGPVLPSVCPNCGFHDISPCPCCGQRIPRQQYVRLGSTLFQCPHCRNRVGLRFNEPMFLSDGTYNQPLVIVEAAEVHTA